MERSTQMPFAFGRLALWSLGTYFLIFQFSDVIDFINSGAPLRGSLSDHDIGLEVASFVSFSSYAFAVYGLLNYGYRRLNRWVLLGMIGVAIVGCMFFRAFAEEVVLKALTQYGNYNPGMTWGAYLLDQLLYAGVFVGLGCAFFFTRLATHNEQARQRSEVLRRDAELNFLRSQVNPHFLFNTLNNLYFLVHRKSDGALVALEKLSGLLRYSLYEKEELVPVEREIAYLEDLIHLESMRIEGLAPVRLAVAPLRRNWLIPPMLLVPFVENAFKHGELRDPAHPLTIELRELSDGTLDFQVSNRVAENTASKDGVGGIGLTNVQQRLRLLYPQRHTFSAERVADSFVVHLRLSPAVSAGAPADRPAAETPENILAP